MKRRGTIAVALSLGLGLGCQTTRGERTASVPPITEAEEEQHQRTAQRELEEERAGALTFAGTVSSIYEDTVFVMNELGRTELLRVGPETRITVAGRDAQLSELREGQEVRASYEAQEGQNLALRISAEEPGAAPQR